MKRMIVSLLLTCIVMTGCGVTEESAAKPQVQQEMVGNIPVDDAISVLEEAREIMSQDGKKLWNHEMNTRFMLIDADSRKFIATEDGGDRQFEKEGDFYTGQLPDDVVIANSVLNYAGKIWAMAIYSPDCDKDTQLEVYVHEMFHTIQPDLKLMYHSLADLENSGDETGSDYYDNSQMEEKDARILLKLEWEALHKAYDSEGDERKQAIEDALAFRLERQAKYQSTKDERKFEIQEGLAEYTSMKLLCKSKEELHARAEADWQSSTDEKTTPSLVRSFGYHSGFMYGLLLDESTFDWKKDLNMESDLGILCQKAYGISSISGDIEVRKNRYQYQEIEQYENARAEKKAEEDRMYRKLFADNILVLPLKDLTYSMDPNSVVAVKDLGNVLTQNGEVSDVWGQLSAPNGEILLDEAMENAIVNMDGAKIEDGKVQGKNWVLTLEEHYQLQKTEKGYVLQKK